MSDKTTEIWAESIAFITMLALGGLALQYVIEPWTAQPWWRCTLALFVIRVATRPIREAR